MAKKVYPKRDFEGEYYSLTLEGVKQVLADFNERRSLALAHLGDCNSAIAEIERVKETGISKGTSLDGVPPIRISAIESARRYRLALAEREIMDINRKIGALTRAIEHFEAK